MLDKSLGASYVIERRISDRFVIISIPTDEEMEIISEGLRIYDGQQPFGELDVPYNDINLVLRDHDGNVVGGVITSMKTGVMHLEVLWIDERFRGQGLGRRLLTEAEKIAKEKGVVSGLTWVVSFNSPEFFQKCGYEVFGVSDGYPDPVKEYYLKKKL
jgi:ribosomal protein S18 acetylase RimI-like enzyme